MKAPLYTIPVLFTALSATLQASPLADWFAKPASDRGPIPKAALTNTPQSPPDILAAKKQVWSDYQSAAKSKHWDQAIPTKSKSMEEWMEDGKISPLTTKIGDKTFPYVVLTRGQKPKEGWPMFFCLHGGGANPRAQGPHTWNVNTREWLAQMKLTTKVWDAPGLYIIPRMADDREGRWYYGYVQQFLDQTIQQGVLFNQVNPDRVYLMGISEGGYTAFRLGSMMADRWAGSCAMAAAEPLNNAPPENMRHVAFRCGIGEKDSMFDRIGLARTYFKQLEALKQTAPEDFQFFFDEQKGRGHGINYQPGPKWIAQYSRNAVPKAFNWTVIKQHDRHRNRMYWLALDDDQTNLPLVLSASAKDNNRIEITAHTKRDGELVAAKNLKLRVYLPPSLIQLDKEVTIAINGKQTFKGMVRPSMEAIIRSTAERGDPKQVFPAQVTLQL
ncbi:hypothetical protein HW115_15405 [Verrucomicrobiaceae bacterium N1E253]|uniref:Uncharacterized protein n=1 Tax=Oceaniferula marina TaxID=2748318 RepID=A0A851GIJ1_9BACT|nr:hypothetical protein [Oceaniferula marina]NWK57009.1 hypothetical protein [Oceaniferula marina]